MATQIKFCGITSAADAERAVAAGAWAIGLILWPHSARACEPAIAAEIAAAFKRRVEVAMVLVNPALEELIELTEAIQPTMLQLHGEEGPAYCAEAARRTGCRVIKAIRVRSGADIQALETFKTDYHLLDSHTEGLRGGTGKTFSWELARSHRGGAPVILSGGLTPENVREAVRIARPFAVDVASGVELEAGRKDPAKLEAFAKAVNEAGPHVAARPPAAHAPPGGRVHAPARTSS